MALVVFFRTPVVKRPKRARADQQGRTGGSGGESDLQNYLVGQKTNMATKDQQGQQGWAGGDPIAAVNNSKLFRPYWSFDRQENIRTL